MSDTEPRHTKGLIASFQCVDCGVINRWEHRRKLAAIDLLYCPTCFSRHTQELNQEGKMPPKPRHARQVFDNDKDHALTSNFAVEGEQILGRLIRVEILTDGKTAILHFESYDRSQKSEVVATLHDSNVRP